VLLTLHNDRQMMHNSLQKINNDTHDLTIVIDVMAGIRSVSTMDDPTLVQVPAIATVGSQLASAVITTAIASSRCSNPSNHISSTGQTSC
jgi:hypothetical protein